ncbi:hypothetical protein EKO23_24055 [Nocardioides guangzhouensis]|uniref:M23 family metallopeptidase n=1 Tax=Nocardioides guangzhouensis TaxID=2497878 RepID=A0A4Q4Z0N7_9ACTN|nr:peptidoglycan DD-metalloendopeptidase family protein [Nocardioides guangzhouensis]RYP81107.1 hypothetical protein EKO23_24055 [Nocardioides guangzhouensis]
MTTHSPEARPGRLRRPLRTAAVAAAAVAPLVLSGLVAGAGAAPAGTAPSGTSARTTTYTPRVPFVARPLNPATTRDLRTYSATKRGGTDFKAACGTPVLAAHPGKAWVLSRPWAGPALVKITTTSGSLVTLYAYMRRATVTSGQLVTAGQQIGVVGHEGNATSCRLQLRVRSSGGRVVYNPTTWLNRYVGTPTPSRGLWGDEGFNVATFNMLGASHTAAGGNKASWPDYNVRLPKQIAMLEAAQVDVAGLQELQRKQRALFLKLAGKDWGIYPEDATADPENSIIYRRSAFTLLEGATFDVPYFNGNIRKMPYVLLQDNATGRTAYVANVHNPATTQRYPAQAKWRRKAEAIERQLVIDLRANARPVFLTGDFNERQKAFCAMTTGKLMISPDSIPSMQCAYPARYYWVDWIFAAGQSRFTTLSVDTSTRAKRLSDHPLVVARTHLAD